MRKTSRLLAASLLAVLPHAAMASSLDCDGDQDYAAYIRAIEGGGAGYSATNPTSSATGAYQFLAGTLRELGYISHLPGPASQYFGDSDWSIAVWTGKDGITSRAQFMASQAAQDRAFAEFTDRNLQSVSSHWSPGQVVNGIPLTAGGVAAATHMLGAGGFRQWAESGFSASGLNAQIAANHNWTQEQYLQHLMGRVARGGCMDPGDIAIGADAITQLPNIFLMPWDDGSRAPVILPGSLASVM